MVVSMCEELGAPALRSWTARMFPSARVETARGLFELVSRLWFKKEADVSGFVSGSPITSWGEIRIQLSG